LDLKLLGWSDTWAPNYRRPSSVRADAPITQVFDSNGQRHAWTESRFDNAAWGTFTAGGVILIRAIFDRRKPLQPLWSTGLLLLA